MLTIGNITYFVNEDWDIDHSIIYNEGDDDWDDSSYIPILLQGEEYISELWSINGVQIKLHDNPEEPLRELWKNGGAPFAYCNAYHKGGTLIYFAYPYWDKIDKDKVLFKEETSRILQYINDNFQDHHLWNRLKKYIAYETFCMNHHGTLNDLFRDYYAKYIRDEQDIVDYDAYYAIYYYLVRLGYWYMDFSLIISKHSDLYINIGNDRLYIDHNISDTMYDNLDAFFHIVVDE